jgi:hypothetical protein
VLGILPLQLLEIHVDHRVKTDDHVYIAIAQEQERAEKVTRREGKKKKKPTKEKEKA